MAGFWNANGSQLGSGVVFFLFYSDSLLWLRLPNLFDSSSRTYSTLTTDSNSDPWTYSTQTSKLEKMRLRLPTQPRLRFKNLKRVSLLPSLTPDPTTSLERLFDANSVTKTGLRLLLQNWEKIRFRLRLRFRNVFNSDFDSKSANFTAPSDSDSCLWLQPLNLFGPTSIPNWKKLLNLTPIPDSDSDSASLIHSPQMPTFSCTLYTVLQPFSFQIVYANINNQKPTAHNK